MQNEFTIPKITPAQACKVLADNNLFVSEKDARIMLDFLYNLAFITQMITDEKSNSLCESEYRRAGRQRLQSA